MALAWKSMALKVSGVVHVLAGNSFSTSKYSLVFNHFESYVNSTEFIFSF